MKVNVIKILKQVGENCEGLFKDLVIPDFSISYDLKSIRTLGSVKKNHTTGVYNMRLNLHLLNEFGDEYIEHVVLHELAHIIVGILYPYEKYGRVKSHGKEFKYVCAKMGYPHISRATTDIFSKSEHLQVKRTHKKPRATFTYVCGCNEFELSSIRHNRIGRGATYRCPSCKSKLVKKD